MKDKITELIDEYLGELPEIVGDYAYRKDAESIVCDVNGVISIQKELQYRQVLAALIEQTVEKWLSDYKTGECYKNANVMDGISPAERANRYNSNAIQTIETALSVNKPITWAEILKRLEG